MKGQSRSRSRARSPEPPKPRSMPAKTSTLPITITISDDEVVDNGEQKDKSKSESEVKGEDVCTTGHKTSPPKCGNESHGSECQGLMPSCQGKVVKELAAWREFVEASIEARDTCADTQADDTQQPELY